LEGVQFEVHWQCESADLERKRSQLAQMMQQRRQTAKTGLRKTVKKTKVIKTAVIDR